MFQNLAPQQIERIATIISEHYTGSQISHFLEQCRLPDPDPSLSKAKRLYNAFAAQCNIDQTSNSVYRVIQYCLQPVQGLGDLEKYTALRLSINEVLMLVGIEIRDDGKFYHIVAAQQLSEVKRRTKDLREKLTMYGAHYCVIACCKDEWLSQDYFHAVQEAAKSLAERVRQMSGLNMDGSQLFETAFKISDPYIALNRLQTSTEKNQQNGLREMMCGIFHLVRNVTAHEMRIRWDINESDAVEILTQISYLHKMLDQCTTVPRIP